eukprot:s4473_g4.t1
MARRICKTLKEKGCADREAATLEQRCNLADMCRGLAGAAEAAAVSDSDLTKYILHIQKKSLELPFETKLFLVTKQARGCLTEYLAGELPLEKWEAFARTWRPQDPAAVHEKFDPLRPRLHALLEDIIQAEETRSFLCGDGASQGEEAQKNTVVFRSELEAVLIDS